MWWLLGLVVQIALVGLGIRQEKRAGIWNWSKFTFTLAFGALECSIVLAPILFLDEHSRYFVLLFTAAMVGALLNFVWFIVVSRRWKLAGKTTGVDAHQGAAPIAREPFSKE